MRKFVKSLRQNYPDEIKIDLIEKFLEESNYEEDTYIMDDYEKICLEYGREKNNVNNYFRRSTGAVQSP